jgi:hypothetical protein
LQLQTNGGTTALTLDTSQNAGFGVTPSAWSSNYKGLQMNGGALQVYTSGDRFSVNQNAFVNSGGVSAYVNNGYASQYLQLNSEHRFYTAPSGTAGNAITFTQAMTLDASGRLLNACTNNAEVAFSTQHSGTSPQGIQVTYTNASPNNSGTGNTFLYCVDTTAVRAYISGNGGIANYSANNVNLSDRIEKTNFAPAKSYLNVICSIPVQTYNYINQNLETDGGLTLGVIAQDVQAVAPELVTESNWGTEETPKMRLSIYQTDLQYALMKCIQELNAKVTTLQTQVTALKG